MESRLYAAALNGNIEELQQLIHENRLILTDYALIYPDENPLHVSTKAGHLGFVKEVIGLKPDLVTEQNRHGFRPMDIASSLGHVEIVKELLTTCGSDLCRLKGREGRSAIHYAAISGKLDVMAALLSHSPECIKDLTTLEETALHLAVKYNRFGAFRVLLEWLQQRNLQTLEEMLNSHDKDGNTILHLAIITKQHEVLQLMLSSTSAASALNWKATNSKGRTAIDLMLDIIIENPSDAQLKEILHRAANAAASSTSSSTPEIIIVPNNQQGPSTQQAAATATGNQRNQPDMSRFFGFDHERDQSPNETRSALLVVFTLIASVALQAGINFPSHILPSQSEQSKNVVETSSYAEPPSLTSHDHGHGDSGIPALVFFITINVSLMSSLTGIWVLTEHLPFRREVWLSLASVFLAYLISVLEGFVSFLDHRRNLFFVLYFIPWGVPLYTRTLPMLARKIIKCCHIRTRRAA